MIKDLDPSTPGVYNLPVCRLYDLSVVPFVNWAAPGPKSPVQWQPCPCMSDQANITVPATGEVQYFRDHVSSYVTNALSTSLGESLGPENDKMGYGDFSCLWSNTVDATTPFLCC